MLGPLEVRDEHGLVSLGTPQQRALLAVLLLHPNEVVSPDRLIDELWDGNPPETAAKLVQVYVSRLRKALEPDRAGGAADLLVTQAPGYMLRSAGRRGARPPRVRATGRGGRKAMSAGASGDAAELARGTRGGGPALADFAFEPFAEAEIGGWRSSVWWRSRIGSTPILHRAVPISPASWKRWSPGIRFERLRGQLMLALYRSGRQSEALAAYRETRTTLVEEVGVETGPELQRLEKAILAQALRSTPVPIEAVGDDRRVEGHGGPTARARRGCDCRQARCVRGPAAGAGSSPARPG